MSDHNNRLAAEAREAAEDGVIVHELAVAGEFDELIEQLLDIVEEVRALGMAGDLRLLPGRKVRVDLLELLVRLLAQLADFFLDGRAAGGFELSDLFFEVRDGLLEFEVGGNGHGEAPNLERATYSAHSRPASAQHASI